MKKLSLVAACASAVLLTACSDVEVENFETSKSNAINFHVVGNSSQTKATPITPDNLNTTDFDVFAFTEDGIAFMGDNNTNWAHTGVKIIYNGGLWDYNNPDELRYWPEVTTPLNFYAVNPGTTTEGFDTHYAWNINHNSQQILYAMTDEYASDNGHPNHDVMYAIAKNQTKNTNGGVVDLKFHHTLSQIVFQAKTQYAGMEVDINYIKIHNVKFSGIFDFPEGDEHATADNWDLYEIQDLGDQRGNAFTVVRTKNDNNQVTKQIIVNSNVEATDITSAAPMLMLPQALRPWAVETENPTKYQADIAHECYLEISCKIKQKDVYILGSESEYKTIFVPFSAIWNPGYRYVYTLIFGGGYDEHGDKILTPITFDAETFVWNDEPTDNVTF